MEFQAVSGPKFTGLFHQTQEELPQFVTSADFGYLQPVEAARRTVGEKKKKN